jgi:phosphohistidine phosphatase
MSRHDATQLCLLRHADAGDPMSWRGPDSERQLSARGRDQAETLGAFLARAGFRPGAMLSSPKVRARETAAIVGAALGLEVRVIEALAGPLDLDSVERILAAASNPRQVVLVGHDPDFSGIASDLAGTDIGLRKGTIIRLDVERPLAAGRGSLRWLLPPDLLGTRLHSD